MHLDRWFMNIMEGLEKDRSELQAEKERLEEAVKVLKDETAAYWKIKPAKYRKMESLSKADPLDNNPELVDIINKINVPSLNFYIDYNEWISDYNKMHLEALGYSVKRENKCMEMPHTLISWK